MTRVALAAFALFATTTYPRFSGACSPASNDGGPLLLDPAYVADVIPPSSVTASLLLVNRPAESSAIGCGGSCGRFPGEIQLQLSAVDESSGTDVGYKFLVVGGTPPVGFFIAPEPGTAIRTIDGSNMLALTFDPDAGSFSFDLEIRAVDLNGNEGAPVVLAIDG